MAADRPVLYVLHPDKRGDVRDGNGNQRAAAYASILKVTTVELKSNRDRAAKDAGVDEVPTLVFGADRLIGAHAINALSQQLDSSVDGTMERLEVDKDLPMREGEGVMVATQAAVKGGRPVTGGL
jgi:hypothetical protein